MITTCKIILEYLDHYEAMYLIDDIIGPCCSHVSLYHIINI